jgi:hypothetical protein
VIARQIETVGGLFFVRKVLIIFAVSLNKVKLDKDHFWDIYLCLLFKHRTANKQTKSKVNKDTTKMIIKIDPQLGERFARLGSWNVVEGSQVLCNTWLHSTLG